MSPLQALFSFTLAAGRLTITPGLDTALILRTATVRNARDSAAVALGIALGCLIWCVLVALGLGALFLLSDTAYLALRVIGAAYLLWLGGQMMIRAGKHKTLETKCASPPDITPGSEPDMAIASSKPSSAWGFFSQGFFNNLLNPKVGAFYLTFMPQFIPKGVHIASFGILLGSIHALEGLLWSAVLILATRPLSRWLKRPEVHARLDRLTGGVLMLFGLKLALEPRH